MPKIGEIKDITRSRKEKYRTIYFDHQIDKVYLILRHVFSPDVSAVICGVRWAYFAYRSHTCRLTLRNITRVAPLRILELCNAKNYTEEGFYELFTQLPKKHIKLDFNIYIMPNLDPTSRIYNSWDTRVSDEELLRRTVSQISEICEPRKWKNDHEDDPLSEWMNEQISRDSDDRTGIFIRFM